MTISQIREGNKAIPEVDFVALSPNDKKDLKLGARDLSVDGFEGANERQRHRLVQDYMRQFRHLSQQSSARLWSKGFGE